METSTKVAVGVVLGVATAIIAAGVAEHYAHASSSNALMAAANALAKVNPCLQSSEGAVRAFQTEAYAAGYSMGASSLADAVDGRYGPETEQALAGFIGTTAPAACSPRPSWWGADGTTTNP